MVPLGDLSALAGMTSCADQISFSGCLFVHFGPLHLLDFNASGLYARDDGKRSTVFPSNAAPSALHRP